MSDALYQEELLTLAKAGRAVPRIDEPSVSAKVDNPVCGDRVTIDLTLDGDTITGVGAKVQGCALCQAATALIAEHAVGRSGAEIPHVADAVEKYLAGNDAPLPWARLSSFSPVRNAKSRWECVLLPFKATVRALSEAGGTAR